MTDFTKTPKEQTKDPSPGINVSDVLRQLQGLAAFVQEGPFEDRKMPEYVGRYRVIDRLGQGGQAEVLLSYDAIAQRSVVIKWYLGVSFPNRERFIAEARAICAVEHPNVIRCLDIGVEQEHPFLVLEPVGGNQLGAARLKGGDAPDQLANWMVTICDAVHSLHRCGWIHGDLSPANIVINDEGTPVLIDFGLAQRVGSTSDLAAPGTTEFRAPELQQSNRPPTQIEGDVYSLGAIMNHLIQTTGQENRDALQKARHSEKHRWLSKIANKAAATLPENRYSNCKQIADTLKHALAFQKIKKRAMHGGKRVAIFALLIGLSITVFGWSRQIYKDEQIEAQQIVAWNNFLATSTGTRPPLPSFQHEFNLNVSCSATGRKPDGSYRLKDGERFELVLNPDQTCYMAVYLLEYSDRNGMPTGTRIHPTHQTPQKIVGHRTHKVTLVPTFYDGRQELLYIVARTEPWDGRMRRNGPGSIRFQLKNASSEIAARGVHAQAALSEHLMNFVVEPRQLSVRTTNRRANRRFHRASPLSSSNKRSSTNW